MHVNNVVIQVMLNIFGTPIKGQKWRGVKIIGTYSNTYLYIQE